MIDHVICCGMLRREIETLLRDRHVEIQFIPPALHVKYPRLAAELDAAKKISAGHDMAFVIGRECHPEMDRLVGDGRIIQARNCLAMLLGDQMAEFDRQARTFYLTSGWLDNWRQMYVEGMGWDTVEARIKFGYYQRALYLDTGLVPIDEEKILDFFEFTQVPVEIAAISLDHLRRLLDDLLAG